MLLAKPRAAAFHASPQTAVNNSPAAPCRQAGAVDVFATPAAPTVNTGNHDHEDGEAEEARSDHTSYTDCQLLSYSCSCALGRHCSFWLHVWPFAWLPNVV